MRCVVLCVMGVLRLRYILLFLFFKIKFNIYVNDTVKDLNRIQNKEQHSMNAQHLSIIISKSFVNNNDYYYKFNFTTFFTARPDRVNACVGADVWPGACSTSIFASGCLAAEGHVSLVVNWRSLESGRAGVWICVWSDDCCVVDVSVFVFGTISDVRSIFACVECS